MNSGDRASCLRSTAKPAENMPGRAKMTGRPDGILRIYVLQSTTMPAKVITAVSFAWCYRPRAKPRERWLTRSETASLIWTCWRARETQTIHRGVRKGELLKTDKRPLQHLARFILVALYTGTRAAAVASASIERGEGRSFVDLDNGIFYRLAEGSRETKKRQPPVPIPPRLLAHLRRWQAKGVVRRFVVEWQGEPVKSVKTAFKSAVRLAGLDGQVTPHTLRHTAATWLMQAGVDKWEAAGFLGMSVEMLDRVYGHHHPQHLRQAAQSIGYRRQNETLAVSLARLKPTDSDVAQTICRDRSNASRLSY